MPWLSANVDALGLHTTTKNDLKKKKKLIKLKDIDGCTLLSRIDHLLLLHLLLSVWS